MDAVVAIGTSTSDGDTRWFATGFLYMRVKDRTGPGLVGWPYLVSNRHVFDGLPAAKIRCNPTGPEPAKEFDIELVRSDGSPTWTTPEDASIDVAVLPVDFAGLTNEGMKVDLFQDAHGAAIAELAQGGVSEGDGVFVLGFPMGMVGGDRSAVIVRTGAIARIGDLLAGATKDFLVDAAVFPGNSGGPVLLCPTMTAIQGTASHDKSLLIGIVKSYTPYLDFAASQQTGRIRVVFEENSGLAAVHPVDFIEQAIDRHQAELPLDRTAAEEPETVPDAGDSHSPARRWRP